MTFIVVYRVCGCHGTRVQTKGLPCVRVLVESGPVATGDVEADLVPLLEEVAGGVQLYCELVDLSRLQEL